EKNCICTTRVAPVCSGTMQSPLAPGTPTEREQPLGLLPKNLRDYLFSFLKLRLNPRIPHRIEGSPVGGLGISRIHLYPSQHLQALLSGDLVQMALAEGIELLSAVRALEIGIILHYALDRNLHLLRHAHGLLYDHLHQILGRGYDDDLVHRQG